MIYLSAVLCTFSSASTLIGPYSSVKQHSLQVWAFGIPVIVQGDEEDWPAAAGLHIAMRVVPSIVESTVAVGSVSMMPLSENVWWSSSTRSLRPGLGDVSVQASQL